MHTSPMNPSILSCDKKIDEKSTVPPLARTEILSVKKSVKIGGISDLVKKQQFIPSSKMPAFLSKENQPH